MSKRGYLSRYLLILSKLKLQPYCTQKELQTYIEAELIYLRCIDDTLDIGFSDSTLKRDIKEIRNLFGVEILYSRTHKGYFINQQENDATSFERMIEAFDMFNSLSLSKNLSPYIYLERSSTQGGHYMYSIVYAVKKKRQLKFNYRKFWEIVNTKRLVEPYALKEFKNRWYVLARDTSDGKLKSFGLDRVSKLEITEMNFSIDSDFDYENTYYNCFGITCPEDREPEELILSFEPMQGCYIKSLPLHHTQQVLADTEKEFKISLNVYVTQDLIMELLSYGDSLKVIAPQSLREYIRLMHQKAFEQYNKN